MPKVDPEMHLPLDADRRLVAQIRASEGVLTREHALQTGLSDRAIDWRVASGRWIRKHPGVNLTQPGNNDWLAEAWAGLLFVGAPAALSGSSAGHAWGLIKEPPRVLEIVTNRPRSARGRPRLTIRRTDRFAQIVSRFHTPRRTTIEDTVFALEPGNLERTISYAAQACQRKWTSPAELLAELERRPIQAHRRLLVEMLGDGVGAESIAEVKYHRDVEAAHGIPGGIRQAQLRSGRHDIAYERERVLAEIDGRLGHEGWVGRQRDGGRDLTAAANGWVTVRVFWPDVALTPCQTATKVAQVLAVRGWTGRPRRCRRSGCTV